MKGALPRIGRVPSLGGIGYLSDAFGANRSWSFLSVKALPRSKNARIFFDSSSPPKPNPTIRTRVAPGLGRYNCIVPFIGLAYLKTLRFFQGRVVENLTVMSR